MVPPVFNGARKIDDVGNFSVDVKIPNQPPGCEIDSVDVPDGHEMPRASSIRRFRLLLTLGGVTVHDGLHCEGTTQHVTFSYTSSRPARLVGTVIGVGAESRPSKCRFTFRCMASDYVVDFDSCQNAHVSNVVIEGRKYGVSFSGSTASMNDCEIILHHGNNRYVTVSDDSTVTQHNVNGHTRTD